MEERDTKPTPPQATSYSTSIPGPSPARMAALPQAQQAHGASPLQSQQQHQAQHYYPQPNGHHAPTQTPLATQHEYRMPSNALPSVSLPPIQHFEPTQNTIPPQQHYQHMPTGDAPHQMTQPHVAYQYQNGTMPMIPPTGQIMYAPRDGYTDRRYTPPPLHPYQTHILPHNPMDPRQMSGGRHKKEIKRRTKTGCLTCRKRRIKCDERQPGCRNCEKSKRECLGYDPIFKQQSGPAPIQPAPMISNPKTENGMTLVYAQPSFQGEQDLYTVGAPTQAVPENSRYPSHQYSHVAIDTRAGQPTATQHYHPPFDPPHKIEPQQPKA
ncbi:hypothetical protein AMS68_007356 [Peltaster fructicola]|uniref:Zn(2)-C6 fungal-type domain-containing protein n=1 Tax=Peltaster fructicola TaxID=286661 RepID=A0A6H0Y4S1_9PEZI|nr:hypothetical protein AMS68_007356 [Peltaster fructicola]